MSVIRNPEYIVKNYTIKEKIQISESETTSKYSKIFMTQISAVFKNDNDCMK